MKKPLLGQKIAVLVANGFSEKDLTFVQKALMASGATLRVVSMDHGLVNSWNDAGWGLNFAADQVLSEALAADYDILIVPGGQRSIEKLKLTAHTRRFVGGFVSMSKPIAFFEESVELLLFSEKAQGYEICGPEKLEKEALEKGATWNAGTECISGAIISGRSCAKGAEAYSLKVADFLIQNVNQNVLQAA